MSPPAEGARLFLLSAVCCLLSPFRLSAAPVEAETLATSGGAAVSFRAASGGALVTSRDASGDRLDLPPAPQPATLRIRYALGVNPPRQLSVYADERDIGTLVLMPSGAWDRFASAHLDIPASRSLRLQIDPDDAAANDFEPAGFLDQVDLVPRPAAPAGTRCATPDEANAALAAAKPGDVIVLKNGDWTDPRLVFRAQGTAEQPVTLRAETPGRVAFVGLPHLLVDGAHLVIEGLRFERCRLPGRGKDVRFPMSALIEFTPASSHCRLTQVEIREFNPAENENGPPLTWVALRGTYHRVDHCRFSGHRNIGVSLRVEIDETPDFHLIDFNHFSDRPKTRHPNWYEPLQLGLAEVSHFLSGTTVRQNLFERCNGENESISNKSSGNRILFNTIRDSWGDINLRHGNGSRVEGNFLLAGTNRPGSGIVVNGTHHRIVGNYLEGGRGIQLVAGQAHPLPQENAPVRDTLVAFNTLVHNDAALTLGNDDRQLRPNTPERVLFTHNLIVTTNPSPVRILTPLRQPTDVRSLGNLVSGPPPAAPDPAAFRHATLPLTRDARGLLRPAPGSPGINGSRPLPDAWLTSLDVSPRAPRLDLDGQPRDATPDIGADELSPAPVHLRPLTASDVGPTWTP